MEISPGVSNGKPRRIIKIEREEMLNPTLVLAAQLGLYLNAGVRLRFQTQGLDSSPETEPEMEKHD